MEVRYSGQFDYSLTNAPSPVPAGSCFVDIAGFDNGVAAVIITEDRRNQGPSVTNVCDRIATQVYTMHLSDVPAEKIVWLEHCPASRSNKAYIDLVQFSRENQPAGIVFTRPQWKRFFEAPRIAPLEFIKLYSFILKELCTATLVFSLEDKKGYNWRVWANETGFFIVSTNPSDDLPKKLLDIQGVTATLHAKQHLIGIPGIEAQFTDILMKSFLNNKL